jgi:hypothetical protein
VLKIHTRCHFVRSLSLLPFLGLLGTRNPHPRRGKWFFCYDRQGINKAGRFGGLVLTIPDTHHGKRKTWGRAGMGTQCVAGCTVRRTSRSPTTVPPTGVRRQVPVPRGSAAPRAAHMRAPNAAAGPPPGPGARWSEGSGPTDRLWARAF